MNQKNPTVLLQKLESELVKLHKEDKIYSEGLTNPKLVIIQQSEYQSLMDLGTLVGFLMKGNESKKYKEWLEDFAKRQYHYFPSTTYTTGYRVGRPFPSMGKEKENINFSSFVEKVKDKPFTLQNKFALDYRGSNILMLNKDPYITTIHYGVFAEGYSYTMVLWDPDTENIVNVAQFDIEKMFNNCGYGVITGFESLITGFGIGRKVLEIVEAIVREYCNKTAVIATGQIASIHKFLSLNGYKLSKASAVYNVNTNNAIGCYIKPLVEDNRITTKDEFESALTRLDDEDYNPNWEVDNDNWAE